MSVRLNQTDEALATAFLTKLRSRDDVASLLEVRSEELRYYLFKARNYKTFEINKRCGGKRLIHAPSSAIKILQQKLNQVLHAVYKGRSPVHGFARGRSIRSNASRHFGCCVLLNFDLADFFPSINFGRVMGLFVGKPYLLSREVAVTLAQICCHNQTLSTGAPSSPVIANMICAQMDSQLKKLAQKNNCVYTRYADDITISTRANKLPTGIAAVDPNSNRWIVGTDVETIVSNNRFVINLSKTRLLSRRERQEVTGLLIDPRLNVKRQIVRQVRAMLHAWKTFGETKAAEEFAAKYDRKQRLEKKVDFKRVVRGKLEFIGFVRGRDDALFLRLLGVYAHLDKSKNIKTVTLTEKAVHSVLTQSIWLLEGDENMENPMLATAFALDGFGLVTAAHNLDGTIFASQPHIGPEKYRFALVRKHDHYDVAQISVPTRVPVQLRLGSSANLQVGSRVTIFGFPDYHVGDGVGMSRGPITQERMYSAVKHFVIQPEIIKGNSGGPILDDFARVVGVAVKGRGTPGRYSGLDELSSFVPIEWLREMK
jgi:RNA-directed DNA polymerase